MKRLDGTNLLPASATLREAIERQRQAEEEWAAYRFAEPEKAQAWLEALEYDHARTVRLQYEAALSARADAKLATFGLADRVVAAAIAPDFGTYEPMRVARDFLASKAQVLVLIGSGGVGKSVAGAWVLREVMRGGGKAHCIRAADLAALSDFDEDDRWRLHQVSTADAVLLDELQQGDLSERGHIKFRDWFEKRRSREHFRTVITANMTKPQFAQCVGPRIVDRLAECGMSREWVNEQSRRERRFPREVTR